ncbi:MAG: hypothetical protein JXI33_08555 [Candidatus Aminicenantes bacterium]|nr:hypothetical protein [Candidatus Aminicenantes bacterium]
MIKRYKKLIAVCVTMAFMTLLPVYAMPQPAGQTLGPDHGAADNGQQAQSYIEKEQQVGYQASPRKILPVLIGIAAVAAAIFLLVILVSKDKYDITGDWDFHNDFITEGYASFDSVWRFTAYDDRSKVMGTYVRDQGGVITQGEFSVVNKSEVVFYDIWYTEQYTGQFDSKTTMSGNFVLDSGAQGTWTATKR